MRALVTGATGFAGGHLVEYLLKNTGLDIWALDIRSSKTVPRGKRLYIREGDLSDLDFVRQSLEEAKPDYLFHLAAQAFVSRSWKDPWETLGNNIRGQLNLLEGLVQLGLSPRTLIVGSGEEYGMVRAEELPIKETNPLRPYSPYAVSKVTQDMMGYQYSVSHRLPIIRVRPFNHIGPRQSVGFVASDFAKQIAEVESGLRPALMKVGNLEARRDFTDVRDMVRAYHQALLKGEPGEVYNIGSGIAYSMEELLDGLLEESTVKPKVEKDLALMRPSDVPVVVCDSTKFRERTGWKPTISFRESLRDILNWWRGRAREGR